MYVTPMSVLQNFASRSLSGCSGVDLGFRVRLSSEGRKIQHPEIEVSVRGLIFSQYHSSRFPNMIRV